MKEIKRKTLRILVVEDDQSIRNILQDMLSLEGHQVVLAPDGEVGLTHLQENSFDLLITDLGLPGITGHEVAQAAKRFHNGISIISISSWQGRETEKKASESGIDITIWKPFKFDQILDAMEELTGLNSKNTVPNQG